MTRKKLKVLTVVGARPQFIKAAPLSRLILSQYSKYIDEVMVHTGQHYDRNMSQVFFDELYIPKPKYNLGIGSMNHGEQTGKMLIELEKVFLLEKPDYVIVYGDTNSTVAGSLAASKYAIPVAHIEAGLRSFNRLMPEEQNRVITDHISNYLFCPTKTAVDNLKNEGIYDNCKIKVSGNKPIKVLNIGDIMYDAIVYNINLARKRSKILAELKLDPKKYVLATVHRAENTDNTNRLKNIFSAFSALSEKVVVALHPRTKGFMQKYGIKTSNNVQIVDPLGYLDMLTAEDNAKAILTDSGGIQKEAYFLKIPCITLRDETEWVETVASGWNCIAGAKKQIILKAYSNIKKRKTTRNNYFGDGNAAEKIMKALLK